MKIIGMSFSAQSGKDTSADYLVQEYNFMKESFAKPLKEYIGKGVFGLSEAQLNDSILKETVDPLWNITPRKILQLAGTEGGRNIFGEDLWVKSLYKRIEGSKYPIAIADVRYKNEAVAIQSWGGIVVRINRNIIGTPATHQSEIDLKDWDGFNYTIDNNGSFQDLYQQLDKIVQEYIQTT